MQNTLPNHLWTLIHDTIGKHQTGGYPMCIWQPISYDLLMKSRKYILFLIVET